MSRYLKSILLAVILMVPMVGKAQMFGTHQAVYDERGFLKPWTSWKDALDREMNWYLRCPVENGYPRFVVMTFMDCHYELITSRRDFIPATQDGMGIISYLKYYAYQGKKDPRILQIARKMGDYLIKEALTPNEGKYPLFSRSTGWASKFPQPPDCGTQSDRPYEIQPDKGGIAGFALVLLYEETHEEAYFKQALHNAEVLVANMVKADAAQTPWPFRADFRTGEPRGLVSGDMVYILRLFDKLIEHGHQEFKGPRETLWTWIRDVQIPDAAKEGALWMQFFEDIPKPINRTAWAPLNMARYLIEKKDQLDPKWREKAKTLIEFVNREFTSVRGGVAVCGEQDRDPRPWGGILSTYGAVLAMYASATKSPEYIAVARQALNLGLYATGEDGCPHDAAIEEGEGGWRVGIRGGWQEDAHTDKIHNYIDAITAFPEWAN